MKGDYKERGRSITLTPSQLVDLLSQFSDLASGEPEDLEEWLDKVLDGAGQETMIVFDRVEKPGRRFYA